MALFDDYAGDYELWYSTPRGELVWRFEREALLQFLDHLPGGRVLDIGCGTGILSRELAYRGLEVTGIDISMAMLNEARKKSYGLGITFLYADGGALPFPESAYDAVVCFTVLEFVDRPDDILIEAWRVLKPGGKLVIGFLNRFSPWAAARRGQGVFTHARFYTYWEMRRLLKRIFQDLDVEWTGVIYFPPWLGGKDLRFAGTLDFFGRRIAKPFSAVIILRIRKK
ncbi:MAG: class I SAM-dependent methyltransferase [Bacillota bacterium]